MEAFLEIYDLMYTHTHIHKHCVYTHTYIFIVTQTVHIAY